MKEMEQKKITALGDSLTRGVVLNESNRYSVLNGSFIDIIREKLGFEIANYGKFGCTVDFGQQVIDRHADDISASEYTFLEFGGNDCDFNWIEVADDPQGDHLPKTTLQMFKEQFMNIVEKVKELGSKPIILSLPPILSDCYFSFFSRTMSDTQKENLIRWLGGDVGIISRWHECYNRELFKIAMLTETPIIDITSTFDTFRGDLKSLYCSDGIHPNAEGHKMIAGAILGSCM